MRARSTVLPLGIWVVMIALVIIYLLKASPVHAAGVTADCDFVAAFSRRMAFFRDIGADPHKVERQIRREVKTPAGGATAEQLVRIARRVMTGQLTRDEAMTTEYLRCLKALGDLGEEG